VKSLRGISPRLLGSLVRGQSVTDSKIIDTAGQNDLLAEFARVYSRHEDREGRERQLSEVVALLRAYLRLHGYIEQLAGVAGV